MFSRKSKITILVLLIIVILCVSVLLISSLLAKNAVRKSEYVYQTAFRVSEAMQFVELVRDAKAYSLDKKYIDHMASIYESNFNTKQTAGIKKAMGDIVLHIDSQDYSGAEQEIGSKLKSALSAWEVTVKHSLNN